MQLLILCVICGCISFLIGFFIARAGFASYEAGRLTRTELISDINKLEVEKSSLKDMIKALEDEESQCKNNLQQSFQQMTDAQDKYNNFQSALQQLELAAKEKQQEQEQALKRVIADLVKRREAEEEQYKKEQEKLENIKLTISAGAEALKQQSLEKEELQKYQLRVSDKDLADIKKLFRISEELFNPRILYMLIWSTYFQKETKDLCSRLGVTDVCGIYKITDLTNDKNYVGQSKNISDRWVSHIKKGLGIDTPTTNALYKGMRENGVWNFTFSLLEKCNEQDLDDCERKWIEIYNSNDYGYNSTKGNKGGK